MLCHQCNNLGVVGIRNRETGAITIEQCPNQCHAGHLYCCEPGDMHEFTEPPGYSSVTPCLQKAA